MKTRNPLPPARKLRAVEITITVTKFRDVLGKETSRSRSTEFTMKLRRNDPRAYIKGDDLYVKRPGAPIRFTLVSLSGDKESYYPAGITFVREGDRNESDRQRLGFLNFPQRATHAEGRTLTILDSYRDRTRVRYKFSVILQRGSDGKIGIIDPGIVHENN